MTHMNSRDAAIDLVARERARRRIVERSLRLSDGRLPYVIPLFSFEKKNKPFVAACGVKVVVARERFLFTAAHVVDALNEEDLWFAASDGEWSNVTGVSTRTYPPEGRTREDDRIDAAVIKLSEPSASTISGPYLGPRGMDINEVQGDATKYLILGYPSTRTKRDFDNRRVTPRPMQYVGDGVDAQRYVSADIAPSLHVAMNFDRKNVRDQNGPTTAAHPRGMSGCGVWRFDSLLKPGSHERDRLVGIFIEYPVAADLLIATRVSVHAELLCHNWPHLCDEFPSRRRFKANIRDAASGSQPVSPNER